MNTNARGKEGTYCLFCEKQLTMFSRLRSESFCSTDHRDAFVESYQKLALERLRASSKRLKARRAAALMPELADVETDALVSEPALSAVPKSENRPFPKRSSSPDRPRVGPAWTPAADTV